jgi:outer membrane protein OmpA-like peptidoglycan-associated protein/tetratricopeptide (TPR) repeat protein
MKNNLFISLLLIAIPFLSYSQEKKLMRQASNAVEEAEYEKAISYYDKALEKDANSYHANAGKGIVLAEYIGNYEQAIPYLEKALQSNSKKTITKLTYDLGKSYHYVGNYSRALYYYNKLQNNPADDPDIDIFLAKRMDDCKYALEHKEIASEEMQWIKNIGKPINTDMPEYGPVTVKDNFIFTSRRKDDAKEKRDGVDGKYFESMYLCKTNAGDFSEARRFTLPDHKEKSNFLKHNESVASVSRDNKTLFIFRNGEIYEGSLEDPLKEPVKLDPNINISKFQSHACLSPDGKTLFFASAAHNKSGGTDIYRSELNNEGKWSEPELLSAKINTVYDEDTPFMNEDGVLYFSSNGLPGYGGFDIYKTRLTNEGWTIPENLGQPVNSSGDESFFTLAPNSSKGYYASSRPGGYGDMDIYEVHYISNEISNCKSLDVSALEINPADNTENDLGYKVSLKMPDEYKNKIKSTSWTMNNAAIAQTEPDFNYTFNTPGTYTVMAQVVVLCDTCSSLRRLCVEKIIEVGNTPILADVEKPTDNPAENKVKRGMKGYLTDEKLRELGWNTSPQYFDYNSFVLRDDAKSILDNNIEVLKKNRSISFSIDGHSDSRGNSFYNKELSRRRANVVKEYCINKGVSSQQIKSVNALGETNLLNECSDNVVCTDEQHQQNRCVQLHILNSQKILADVSVK